MAAAAAFTSPVSNYPRNIRKTIHATYAEREGRPAHERPVHRRRRRPRASRERRTDSKAAVLRASLAAGPATATQYSGGGGGARRSGLGGARRSPPLSPSPTSALSHRVLQSKEGKSERRWTAFSNKSELACLPAPWLHSAGCQTPVPHPTPHSRLLGKSSRISSHGSTYPSASRSSSIPGAEPRGVADYVTDPYDDQAWTKMVCDG